MAHSSYSDRLKKATDLATKATLAEASLSSLSPLVSPLPTLHKAFPLYISAAEQYSHLLSSNLAPEGERAGIKKKWRLVLERAEKVKKRIEDLGGHVGKIGVGDEAEEQAVIARGGNVNGLALGIWREPHASTFTGGKREVGQQPELSKEQEALDPEWAEVDASLWDTRLGKEEWSIRQGAGADCSVVAGFGACLEHNRRWGTTLVQDNMAPRNGSIPQRSEHGIHVVKLLLNGAWRSIIIDSLLPRSKPTGAPLHATSHPADSPTSSSIGPPWIPLILKAYFKAHGGYSLRGSNPSPDIYTLTGWIPERLSLRDGFQREKEWRRLWRSWGRGEVIVTLGTGSKETMGQGLVPYHAYAVLDIKEDEMGERLLKVYDPGIARYGSSQEPSDLSQRMGNLDLGHGQTTQTGSFWRDWDTICAEFETLNLNWNPATFSSTAIKHWSWGKPKEDEVSVVAPPRYRLQIRSENFQANSEVWILLSQHVSNKDRSLDDIALVVQDDQNSSGQSSSSSIVQGSSGSSPFSNAVHVLYRHSLRKPNTSLTIIPLRDRGIYRTDFTLQAFAPRHTSLSLERISATLPFSTSITGSLTTKNAGGHAGLPSWIDNPQYKLVVSSSSGSRSSGRALRTMLQGDSSLAWNVKLLWGKGELVHEWDSEGALSDSGAYTYGMAFIDLASVEPGSYTLAVSSFEPRQTGRYSLSIESDYPVTVTPIPAEGAGMYSRVISGVWNEQSSGGRPSGGSFEQNPKIEITLARDCNVSARGILPIRSGTPTPLNITLFDRKTGSVLGDQAATSGPYSDAVSGVSIAKTAMTSGIYVLVISPWERRIGIGEKWEVRIWADGPLEAELSR